MIEMTNGRSSEEWPTARAVALELGCSRHQVYRLEKAGKLAGKDVRTNGVRLRRFDPATVRALADAAELDQIIESDLEASEKEDEDEDAAGPLPSGNAMALIAKTLTETRVIAIDARRGQHEAFELIAKPTREFCEMTMRALAQAHGRVAELEAKLSAVYDEHREARLEERESAMMAAQLERSNARKDQFFRTFLDMAPAVLEQVKTSLRGGPPGPLADFMRDCPPEKQKKVVMAIESVISLDDPEPPAAGASAPNGSSHAAA